MLLNGGRLGSVRILNEASVKMMGDNQIGSIFVEEQPVAVPARSRPMPLAPAKTSSVSDFRSPRTIRATPVSEAPGA
jgi:hypothetical protein